jgi:hypothetical protein
LTTVKGKGLIFIFEEAGANKFIDSARSAAKEFIVVCAEDEISRKLSDAGYVCKTLSDYSQNNIELQNAVEWMKAWPDKTILNGKSFKELLVYQGVSIYWFLQTRFYLHRVRELIILIERIKCVLNIEKPDIVWIKGSQDARYVISSLYRMHNIAGFEQLEETRSEGVRHRSYRGNLLLKLLLLKLLRGTFVAPLKSSKNDARGRILVITEVSNWRKDFDYELKRYETRDIFFHNIIRKLLGLNYDVTVVDFENRPDKLLKTYTINKSRQESFGVPVKPWEKYINFKIIMRSRQASRRFNELWKQLQASDDFRKSLEYNGVSLYELIRHDIADLLGSLKAYTAVTLIEAAKRAIEEERPNIVLMHDEYGALQLSFIHAARAKGIPTVSLQHGLISEEQISYVHEPEHISGERHDLLFPIPDKMCAWSEDARQDLIEIAKFPQSVPVITGDPKIDFLPSAIRSFNHEEITKRLGIPKGNIIMFATENLPSEHEKSLITKSVFKAAKSLPECYVIVKMHPNEANTSYYELAAKEAGLLNYSIVRDVNLYELLYISNLVILSYSTVAVEAMRMGKPVISLNLMGLHDNVSFIKNRRAFVIRNPDELPSVIRNCLDNTDEVQEIVEKGKAFAEQELGAADGKASERVVELILQLDRDYKKLAQGAVHSIGKQ